MPLGNLNRCFTSLFSCFMREGLMLLKILHRSIPTVSNEKSPY